MRHLVWLVVLFAVAGCGGATPTSGGTPTPEPKPPATPPKGTPAALPE